MKMKLTFQAGIHVVESETDCNPADMRRVFNALIAEVDRAMSIVLDREEGAEK